MLEQIELWKQTRKLVRVVVNYGNDTVRSWIGYVKSYDQTGIALEIPAGGRTISQDSQLVCFPWYTATEISAEN